jgi:hypothetical protein
MKNTAFYLIAVTRSNKAIVRYYESLAKLGAGELQGCATYFNHLVAVTEEGNVIFENWKKNFDAEIEKKENLIPVDELRAIFKCAKTIRSAATYETAMIEKFKEVLNAGKEKNKNNGY